jgi:hypothetical protein
LLSLNISKRQSLYFGASWDAADDGDTAGVNWTKMLSGNRVAVLHASSKPIT